MASTNKCKYCGSTITSEDQTCPKCGAPNDLYVVDTPKRITHPTTIAELQEYCAERGMPLLRMRFFIGEDFKEPRAFGIYKDPSSGDFIVYKNKDTGERAIRYRGNDEQYAVNELFQKLLSECHNRGIYPDGKRPQASAKNTKVNENKIFGIFGIFIAIFIIGFIIGINIDKNHPSGYYNYNNNTFYYTGNNWYVYDSYSDDWTTATDYDTSYIYDSKTDYYDGDDWNSTYGVSDYKDSDYYYDSSSDDSYSDSYDSWDSGSTDWGSDW